MPCVIRSECEEDTLEGFFLPHFATSASCTLLHPIPVRPAHMKVSWLQASKVTHETLPDSEWHRPCWKAVSYPLCHRPITNEECKAVVEAATAAGLHRLHHERPGSEIARLAEA